MISFLAQRRRALAAGLQRLTSEQRALAAAIARLFWQAATARNDDGQPTIPNRQATRDALRVAIWLAVLRPYYWGQTDEPFRGATPLSPFAQTLFASIASAVSTEVAHQVSIIQRATRNPVILAWLFAQAERAEMAHIKPTYAEWVDPAGLRLADRVVRAGIDARARVNRFVDYHVGRGTPLPVMTERLEAFLTTGERQRTPYGQQGSYGARRLLATETKVAAGFAAINASAANPAVAGIKWQLNRIYDESDRCDRNSIGGPDGDGVYPATEVPFYPDHVGEQCTTPGQMVKTICGEKAVESVAIGDLVLTHEGRYRPVLKRWVTPHDDTIYRICSSAGQIEVTGNHPVLLRSGWVDAQFVQPGDEVLYAGINAGLDLGIRVAEGGHGSGNPLVSEVATLTQAQSYYSTVLSVETFHYTGNVYNLTVADDQGYTVNGACVHNCDLLPAPLSNPSPAMAALLEQIETQAAEALRLRGAFSPEALLADLLGASRQPALALFSPRVWVRNPDGSLAWRFRDPNQANPSPPTALLRQRQAERQSDRVARERFTAEAQSTQRKT